MVLTKQMILFHLQISVLITGTRF